MRKSVNICRVKTIVAQVGAQAGEVVRSNAERVLSRCVEPGPRLVHRASEQEVTRSHSDPGEEVDARASYKR
jgi:hypothetical protein